MRISVAKALSRRPALVPGLVVALLASSGGLASPDGVTPEESREAIELFEARVRPLLIETCSRCHGPKRQQSGLRVDGLGALLRGGERGPAIVPGDPARSLLVRALDGSLDDLRMPPRGEVPRADVEALARWVGAGAPWPNSPSSDTDAESVEARIERLQAEHWAFRPIADPSPPAVRDPDRVREGLDRFVVARLEAAGLEPSPEAGRRTIARRAWFDLVGLPPPTEDVEAFVDDDEPEALEKLIDGLLARPQYGERWGRHWLDVARYSDTKGYVDGGERRYPFAWTYRDWVVRALAEDLPYDSFVTAQLAADIAPEHAADLAALGFLTVGSRYNFFPHEILDDRIDVTARGLLALTVGCARCHDHKYDPIPAEDYYALHGIFASSVEPPPHRLPVLAGSERKEDAALVAELEKTGRAYETRRSELHRAIVDELRTRVRDYLVYLVQLDPRHRTVAQPPLRTEWGVLREATAYGGGAVASWRRAIDRWGEQHRVFGYWSRVEELEREEFSAGAAEVLAELGAADAVARPLAEALRARRPSSMVEVAEVYGEVLQTVETKWRRLSGSDGVGERLADPDEEALRQVLHGADSPASIDEEGAEDFYHLGEHVDVRGRFAAIERVLLKSDALRARAMAIGDKRRPVEPRVFLRGDPTRPGAPVERGAPLLLRSACGVEVGSGSGRRELAAAIVDPRNPLTSRVIVNRIWGWHFGRPLVETPSDFGARSVPPSHPGLLDWLASRLVEEGWSWKRLHRRILLSSTWRQESRVRAVAATLDPDNRLLWRQNPRRLDFEALRDTLLALGGRLTTELGGPPIAIAPDDPGGSRRTLYGLIDRENLPGVLRIFDFPSADISAPRRPRTTVAQQALFLLNSPFVIAQAAALAELLPGPAAEADLAARVDRLYRRLFSRGATASEVALARRYLSAAAPAPDTGESQRPSAWRYGHGRLDVDRGRLDSFTPLPHFDGERWAGGERYPDAELAWLRLDARGGHAGVDASHAAVRRWVAPADGFVAIEGQLAHGKETCGDGVRGTIIASGAGRLGSWRARLETVDTHVERLRVQEGDTIDFVVDAVENHTCDEFEWAPTVRWLSADVSRLVPSGGVWSATEDFALESGREAKLDPWTRYVQALLGSNELQFVD